MKLLLRRTLVHYFFTELLSKRRSKLRLQVTITAVENKLYEGYVFNMNDFISTTENALNIF